MTKILLGNLKGPKGDKGDKGDSVKGDPGPAGPNTVPTNEAIAAAVAAEGPARTALNAAFAPIVPSLELVAASAYGHSYVMGDQVDAGTSWPDKVASRLRTRPLNQRGVGGTMSSRTADIVLSTWTPGNRGLVMMMCLINDVRHLSGNPAGEHATLEHVRAALAYLTAGAAYNAATASNFAYAGTWTAGPTDAQGGASKQTSQVGASVEIAFNGDTAYILTRTGTLASSVKIVDSGTGATQTVNLGGFADAGAKVIRLSGYGPGAHTVRVTAVTVASPVIINAVLIPSTTPPTIVLVREGPAVAYPNGQDPVTTNAALLTRFSPALDVLEAEFPTLALTPKQGPTGWNAAKMSGPDGLHPNDEGTACIASTAIEALRARPFRTGQNIGPTPMFASVIATLGFIGVPAMVNAPSTSYSSGQVTLTWSAPALAGGSAITDYSIQYRASGSSAWTTWAHAASATTSATITGLTNGTAYEFQVAAINASGSGSYSPTVAATPALPTVPSQVSGVVASPDAAGVALTWTAPASGGSTITDYAVQYRVTGAGSWTTFAHAASTATSTKVTGLAAATQYDFQVAAVNERGTGAYSATTTTKTYRAFDSFDRADTTAAAGLGATSFGALTWSTPATPQFGITSNQAKGTTGNTADLVTFVDSTSSDVTVSATVVAVGDSGVVARLSDQSNFWMLRTGGSPYTLYKKVGNAYSTVFASSVSPAVGDKVKLVCSGASIQMVVNGTVLHTAIDSFNQTATRCGLRQGAGAGTPIFDDFGIV